MSQLTLLSGENVIAQRLEVVNLSSIHDCRVWLILEQYRILRREGTEHAFTRPLNGGKDKGIYK
jgi:peptide methionine sulfoxide reductase MsrB